MGTLPQLKVDYKGLSELLFAVGSDSGVRRANREVLYKLGKGFKDVVEGAFPLGPDVSDEEEVEKVSVKKGVKNLREFEEKMLAENVKAKKEYKKLMKAKKLENGTAAEKQSDPEHSLKRPSEEVTSEDEPEEKKTKVEENSDPKSSDHKEKEKKRKREQKRRRRERKLKEAAEQAEKERQAQHLIEKDLERKIALDGESKAKDEEVKKVDNCDELGETEKEKQTVEGCDAKRQKKKKNKKKEKSQSVDNSTESLKPKEKTHERIEAVTVKDKAVKNDETIESVKK